MQNLKIKFNPEDKVDEYHMKYILSQLPPPPPPSIRCDSMQELEAHHHIHIHSH